MAKGDSRRVRWQRVTQGESYGQGGRLLALATNIYFTVITIYVTTSNFPML